MRGIRNFIFKACDDETEHARATFNPLCLHTVRVEGIHMYFCKLCVRVRGYVRVYVCRHLTFVLPPNSDPQQCVNASINVLKHPHAALAQEAGGAEVRMFKKTPQMCSAFPKSECARMYVCKARVMSIPHPVKVGFNGRPGGPRRRASCGSPTH